MNFASCLGNYLRPEWLNMRKSKKSTGCGGGVSAKGIHLNTSLLNLVLDVHIHHPVSGLASIGGHDPQNKHVQSLYSNTLGHAWMTGGRSTG